LEYAAFHTNRDRCRWSDVLYNMFGVNGTNSTSIAPQNGYLMAPHIQMQQRMTSGFGAQPPFHSMVLKQSEMLSQRMQFNQSVNLNHSNPNHLNPGFAVISPPKQNVKCPPTPPMIYVPSKAPSVSKSGSKSNAVNGSNGVIGLDANYRDLQKAANDGGSGEYDKLMALIKEATDREEDLVNDPKDLLEGLCPEMGSLERKTTRDELLGNSKGNKADSNSMPSRGEVTEDASG